MDSSNIDNLISMADQAMIDFSDSDLSGNIGDRSPEMSSAHTAPSAPASIPSIISSKTSGDFTDSMADSLDSPEVPAGIRVPQDPTDSISSSSMTNAQTSRSVGSVPITRSKQVNQPSHQPSHQYPQQQMRQPTKQVSRPQDNSRYVPVAQPPLRMPNPRASVEQTMRNIATRHNLQGTSAPQTRLQNVQNMQSAQTVQNSRQMNPIDGQRRTVAPVNPQPKQIGSDNNQQVQNNPDQLANDQLDDPINPQDINQLDDQIDGQNNGPNNGPNNDSNVNTNLPDHMMSVMGYAIPIATLYLILILVMIAVGLYFWTAPPTPKKEDKKKKEKDSKKDDSDSE